MKPALIAIGSDHAGFSVKEKVRELLAKEFSGIEVKDCGCFNESSVDYPDLAQAVGETVAKRKDALGILVCGSGIGVAIAANKINGVRAATAWDATSARLSREHNDANVVCFGSRLVGIEVVNDIVRSWIGASFQAGRHANRVEKIRQLENK